MASEKLEKELRRGTEIQRECARRCYAGFKGGSFNFMFNECSRYQEGVRTDIQKPLSLCWIFKGILEDVKNAQNGRTLHGGITYPAALKEIAEMGLEDIPEEAYKGAAAN